MPLPTPSAVSTRRTLLRSAMPIPLAFLAACGPGGGLPFLSKGPKVIRAAAFLGSDPGILTGGERSTVELQKAANTVNQQQLGFEVKVDFLTLPPRPTANPNPPASGSPTPTPFAATASALEQAFAGSADASGSGAGNPPPDLALLTSAADLPILLERKLVAAVDDAARADSPVKWGDFVPGALEMVRSKGKLAAIPLAGNPAILLYDSALFSTGGVAKPDKSWTWNSLIEAGRRLTRAGSDQEVWGINAYGSLPLLLSLIWSQNGEVITKDGKKAQLSDPATREGIQMWADLILRHKIAPTPPSGGSVGLSLTPNEIGLTGVAVGGAALGAGPNVGFTTVVIQGGPGGGAPPADSAVPRVPASRQRLAMAVNNSPVLPGLSSQPPTILASDVPKGKRQATYQTLSAALALTTKAADPKLALRAALALADQLLESPVAGIGYPVRKPDPGMLRRVQPRLSEEDAAVMANALTYARGLPPEVTAALPRILVSRLMDPIASGRASIEDAIRDASSALDDVLK